MALYTVKSQFSSLCLIAFSSMVLTTPARPIWAAPTPEERARSDSLFNEATKLMDEGKFNQACPKLEESLRLEEMGGTALNLGLCYLKIGRTASAWAEFDHAYRLSARIGKSKQNRMEQAMKHKALLEPKLSKVTLEVLRGAQDPGLEIKIDNSIIGSASWGTPFPLDPGEHQVFVSAPGKKSWKTTFTLGDEADRKSIQIPILDPQKESSMSTESSSSKTSTSKQSRDANSLKSPIHTDEKSSAPNRLPAYIVGGVGVAALGVGLGLGLKAHSVKNEANALVGIDDESARTKMNSARGLVWGSRISMGLGIVGLGVGTVLFFTAKPKPSTTQSTGKNMTTHLYGAPIISHETAGFMLGGTF